MSHSLVIQFLVQGFGTDDDFQRRQALEQLVGQALEADDNGSNTSGDGGSGTMNAFYEIRDPLRARERVLQVLREAGQLDDGLIVVHEIFPDDDDDGEGDSQDEIWWPEDYPFQYSMFGPYWIGLPPEEKLAILSDGVRSLQGRWQVIRYDSPDGSDVSAWASQLQFLIAGDYLMVRQDVAIVSAGRIRVDAPGELDLRPILGPNRGRVSLNRYELRGDELHICVVTPDDPRPEAVAPSEERQPGRMVLRREARDHS